MTASSLPATLHAMVRTAMYCAVAWYSATGATRAPTSTLPRSGRSSRPEPP